jgi:hypothetical protein
MQAFPPSAPVQQVVYKKRSFLSTLAFGFGALLVTLTLCSAAVVLYGMNIADRKSRDLVGLLEQAVRGLPDLQKSLPPVLADVLRDERRPDYLAQVAVSAKVVETRADGQGVRPVIEIQNRGPEVISLLCLNVVLLDRRETPVARWTVWAASPIAADRDWPGPLLPGSTRRLDAGGWRGLADRPEDLRAEVEVSDLRLWRPAGGREREL